MPAWSEIDPVAVGRNLGSVWSWKYDHDTDSFTGRLAGEDILRAFGKSPRGLAMTEFFPAPPTGLNPEQIAFFALD